MTHTCDSYANVPKPRPTQTTFTAPQSLYYKHGSQVDIRRDASKQIVISFPAVKITGTLPSLTSSTLCNSPDSSVIPTRSSVELSPSTSSIDVPLVSDALPSLSLSVITEEIPDGTANKDATNEDYVLDIMDFPTDANDMELGNFLLDAADWL